MSKMENQNTDSTPAPLSLTADSDDTLHPSIVIDSQPSEVHQRETESLVNVVASDDGADSIVQTNTLDETHEDDDDNEEEEKKSNGELIADRAMHRIIFTISPIAIIVVVLCLVSLVLTTYLLRKK